MVAFAHVTTTFVESADFVRSLLCISSIPESRASSSPMSGTISISKLKSELRQAQRLVSRSDKLNATLRVETERRIESLKSLIGEEQQRRGEQEASNSTAPSVGAAQAAASVDDDAVKQNGTESAADETSAKPKSKNKKSAKEDKYKMLRHVEFQKSTRRLKQAERELAAIQAQLDALPKDDDSKSARKAVKALEKEQAEVEKKRQHALIDAWYGVVSLPFHTTTYMRAWLTLSS